MKRKTILLTVFLVVITILATSVFWYTQTSGRFWLPRFIVEVRWGGVRSRWPERVLVVFFQDNRSIASCVVSWSHQSENITLPEGSYIVKLYNADSGVFVKQREIYVVKNIEFVASP